MKIGSLFSGIGGLERGVQLAEPDSEVLWQAEKDPYALSVLAHHWPTVTRYTDVRDVNEETARVDVICGGFPCQPHSFAGKRRGTGDERWIWPEFARIVGELKPSLVFIENVPGLRTSGLRAVLADLAELRFNAEWDLFSAAEVGAPHRRIRLFVLAYANCEHGWLQSRWRSGQGRTDPAIAANDGANRDVANSAGISEREPADKSNAISDGRSARDEPRGRRELVADTDGSGKLQSGRTIVGERGWALDGCEPADHWATEPDVGRVAYGVQARSHRLRLLGNAVVPQQAALAWKTLIARSAQRL